MPNSNSSAIAKPYITVEGEDKRLLNRLYYDQYKANNHVIDKFIERQVQSLVKSRGCVRKHSQHTGSKQDKYVGKMYGGWSGVFANIMLAPTSGSTFEYDNPIEGWRNSAGHWNNIMSTNRMGCSATVEDDTYCILCYYMPSDTDYGCDGFCECDSEWDGNC